MARFVEFFCVAFVLIQMLFLVYDTVVLSSNFFFSKNYFSDCLPGAVFTKGLSQVLGLSWLYFYTKVKPTTWLRPFVNTAPGVFFIFKCTSHIWVNLQSVE